MTILILAAAALASSAPRADAYVIRGLPWPGEVVTYHSPGGARSQAIVDRAARIWNRAGVGAQLRRSSPLGARVFVSGTPGRCRGSATVGYPGKSYSHLYVGRCTRGLMILTVAHEFGHVLGLGHEFHRCALMNPAVSLRTGTPSRCRSRPLRFWLERPLRSDDVRGARAITALRPGYR